MSFLAPAFLGALTLLGIPILIHLIRRRRLHVVRWAAMEFLRHSQRKLRRRLRIEELILLALRLLIVLLAVLAFARPVLRAVGLSVLGQNAHVYAIVVVDNSFSMAQRVPNQNTAWERAVQQAKTILTHVLRPGDAVSLLLANDHPTALIGSPTYDLRLAYARLNAAKLSTRGTDYLETAKQIVALLKKSPLPNHEVYWISDDQADAWKSSQAESAHGVWKQLGSKARLIWISVGAPASQRDNLAVHMEPLERELVTPHLAARISAKISNYGTRSYNSLPIVLRLDGQPAGMTKVNLAPHSSSLVTFTPYLPQAGIHVGNVELADPEHADNLPLDNVASFVLESRANLRVLVQEMQPQSATYALAALAPVGGGNIFQPTHIEGESLETENLSNYQAIIITGLTHLSGDEAHALADYVRAGGGLLLFPSEATQTDEVNAALKEAGLLPAALGKIVRFPYENAQTLNPGSIGNYAPLGFFKDTSNINLGLARFTAYRQLTPLDDSSNPGSIQVVLRFGDGSPALVQRQVGRGQVMLAASSADTSWNDLPLTASYVPLLYQLLLALSASAEVRHNLALDMPFQLPLPLSAANSQIRITRPDGTVDTRTPVLGTEGAELQYSNTQMAGVYRVSGGPIHEAFAVALPEQESDLTYVAPNTALSQIGYPLARAAFVTTPEQLSTAVNRSRYGVEIWRLLVEAVIVLLFLESFLAWKFGRRG